MKLELPFRQNPLTAQALEIATLAHKGQSYGDREYVEHPIEVALLARNLGYNACVQACCLLHDVPEDTVIQEDDLLARGVPLVVVEGVRAVTYRGVSFEMVSKVAKARSHPVGHVTKFCDSSRNFASTIKNFEALEAERKGKAAEFVLRYADNISTLLPGLPTPAQIEAFTQVRLASERHQGF